MSVRHAHGSHPHTDHHHEVSPDSDRRYPTAALALIAALMAAEVAVGLTVGSLALISDAAHLLAAVLGYEAAIRLIDPPQVQGGPVLLTALGGVAVNIIAVRLIVKANRTSLNVEGAFQHLLNDLWAFTATAAAGLVVLLTGFTRADPLASLLVVALMAKAGYALERESWKVLLEAAPADLDPERIGAELASWPGVAGLRHLHIWTITSGYPALSAHLLVRDGRDCHALRSALQDHLATAYGISHATLQTGHTQHPEALEGPVHCAAPRGTTHH
ncbi:MULTISPECIES: cation diffusion facilitator family transporter [unclassified Streptomyces]|uniref:cation diffusion facilitator family transporter n=1 Tax=unclassified Streptomyces TaxID=2593676 RepID=UPI000DC75527|nr:MULTISPECIES: cation diffusion facilitator family transporter [unclassified Streptomyces]AWZ05819.1 cation transporter [Streptomyces sp. ICC4]AWZ13516.1 cation transporter [Streptomyces sp. ICC1]